MRNYPKGRHFSSLADNANVYATPADGVKELVEHFHAWTSGLSGYSMQATFALIGANWALHESADAVATDANARLSLVIAVAYLAVRLVLYGLMVWFTWYQLAYAERDKNSWAREFKESLQEKGCWPYLPAIHWVGHILHVLNVVGPTLAGPISCEAPGR